MRLLCCFLISLSASDSRLATGHELPADDDAALGEIDLLPNLPLYIPPRLRERRRNEFGADVAFGEVFLAHADRSQMNAEFFLPATSCLRLLAPSLRYHRGNGLATAMP